MGKGQALSTQLIHLHTFMAPEISKFSGFTL
jgi:hypothetical protein